MLYPQRAPYILFSHHQGFEIEGNTFHTHSYSITNIILTQLFIILDFRVFVEIDFFVYLFIFQLGKNYVGGRNFWFSTGSD